MLLAVSLNSMQGSVSLGSHFAKVRAAFLTWSVWVVPYTWVNQSSFFWEPGHFGTATSGLACHCSYSWEHVWGSAYTWWHGPLPRSTVCCHHPRDRSFYSLGIDVLPEIFLAISKCPPPEGKKLLFLNYAILGFLETVVFILTMAAGFVHCMRFYGALYVPSVVLLHFKIDMGSNWRVLP